MKIFADMTQISVHANDISFASSGCVQRTHGDTSIGSFPTTGEGWKLMRRQRRRSLHHSAAVLHRLLHLPEGTHAYRSVSMNTSQPMSPSACLTLFFALSAAV